MSPTVGDAREHAQALFSSSDFARSLQAAQAGLSEAPDDVELLIVAGRAAIEVDDQSAVEHLRRATELAPENASAWHHLGEALAADGEMSEADGAFRRAVELDPSDQAALAHLGHTSMVAGRQEEGLAILARAAEAAPGTSSASISLVDIYRSQGEYGDALAQARLVADSAPEDRLAWLDVAELSLAVDALDEAQAAFERLRELDDVPGHEVYPLHGMLQGEIRRGDRQRARDLARQVAAIEPHGLGTNVTTFLSEEEDDEAAGARPSQEEVDAALAASLASYRRMLIEDRRLSSEALGG